MTVFASISVKGIRNSEHLFVNTKLCSYIVRLAQWKNKMVIFDGMVFLLIVTLVNLTALFFSDGKPNFAWIGKILQCVMVVLDRISLKCNATN